MHDCFIPILPSPFIHTFRNLHVAPVPFYDLPSSVGAILISTLFCPNIVLQRSLTIHSPLFYVLDIYSPSQVCHGICCPSILHFCWIRNRAAGAQDGRGRRACRRSGRILQTSLIRARTPYLTAGAFYNMLYHCYTTPLINALFFSQTLPNNSSTLTTPSIPRLASMASFTMAFSSKKEEEGGLNSYYNNKTTIIQEARVFNDSPISPRKCRALLTRIVYLLYVGETFSTQEATTLFFGTTKLFQHKDVRLDIFLSDMNIHSLLAHVERATTGRISRCQRISDNSRGRHHDHSQHHEGHATQF